MGVKLGTCEGAQELGAARRDPRGKSLEGKRGRTGSTDRRGGEGPFARRRLNRLTGAACVSLPDRRLAPRRDERAGGAAARHGRGGAGCEPRLQRDSEIRVRTSSPEAAQKSGPTRVNFTLSPERAD